MLASMSTMQRVQNRAAHQGILLTYLWNPAPDTVIGIPIYVIHHNPTYWPEPEQFRPERFLKASLTIYVHRTSKIKKKQVLRKVNGQYYS